MKGRMIALDHVQGLEAAALVEDGVLQDLLVDLPDGIAVPGAIARARLGRPMKGMGGAFVDLPGGMQGFLRATKGLRPGQTLLAQVAGLAEPGKAVPVNTRLVIKSRYAILTPDAPGLNVSRAISDESERARLGAVSGAAMAGAHEGLGLILRSACEGIAQNDISADLADLRTLTTAMLADLDGSPEWLLAAPAPHEAAWRDWPVADTLDDSPGSFARHGLLEDIQALLRADVALSGGAGMCVEATNALIAVDVNTGSDTSPAAGLKANIAAARDLPRQLRLRGLGGQVVVDFAPCPKKDRQVLEQSLRAAFRREGRDAVLAGWTPLGNFELTRKRDRVPLSAVLRADGFE